MAQMQGAIYDTVMWAGHVEAVLDRWVSPGIPVSSNAWEHMNANINTNQNSFYKMVL